MDADLVQFLYKRGISKQEIDTMLNDKIDRTVIQVADDSTLARYISKQGDRIAVKQFCAKPKGDITLQKKQTLLDTLRRKLLTSDEGTSTPKEHTMPKKVKHLCGNVNAKKATRKIEIGWLHFDSGYKQVKKSKGGGTRKIDMPKSSKKNDIIEEAKLRFFPEGISKLGPLKEFEIDLRDFSQDVLKGDDTVGEMYDKTGMPVLRFYLTTKRVTPVTPSSPQPEMKKISKRSLSLYVDLEESSTSPSDSPSVVSTTTSPKSSLKFVTVPSHHSPASSPLPDPLGEFFIAPTNWEGAFENDNIGAEVLLHSTLPTAENDDTHYRDEDVSFDVPVKETDPDPLNPRTSPRDDEAGLQAEAERDVNVHEDASNRFPLHPVHEADTHLENLSQEQKQNYVEITVHRGSTAFFEIIAYFKDPDILNKVIEVNRILPNGQKEMAFDTGGVVRDMISEFWTTFYDMCTVGKEAKVPSLRHDLGNTEWQAIGRIMLYGYKTTGYWPVKLSKAFMASVIYEEVESSVLMADFWKYVAASDKEVLQQACEDFSSVDTDDLLESLDSYECRTCPNAENIRAILLEIAHIVLVQKPTFVSNCIREQLLKANVDKVKMDALYDKINPTARRVIGLLCCPENMNAIESEVAKHLKRYVKDMDKEKLGDFMRFCTGSDLLTIDKISVEFSALTGTERRPTAHTCGCVLQLPRTYESYMDFRYEFDNVLSHKIWIMDIV